MELQKIGSVLQRLHQDEAGDIPVGQVLIIGMVVIPLVVALVMFGKQIAEWLGTQWSGASGQGSNIQFPTQ